MSRDEFEDRLAEALGANAEDAPTSVGLVSGARSRARRRRSRRAALVGLTAVLVVAVPTAVVADRPAGRGFHGVTATATPSSTPSVDPSGARPDWQTISHDGAAVDLPSSWVEVGSGRCYRSTPRADWGPAGSTCSALAPGITYLHEALFDPVDGPGLRHHRAGWTGYEIAGPTVVSVHGVDHDTSARILASVRPSGGPEWQHVQAQGAAFDVPPDWVTADGCEGSGPLPSYVDPDTGTLALTCDERDAVVVSHGLLDASTSPGEVVERDGQWTGYETFEGADGPGYVTASTTDRATTQHLLDTVAAAGPSTPWSTVVRDGVSVDLPPGCEIGIPSVACDVWLRSASTYQPGGEPGRIDTVTMFADGPAGGSETTSYEGYVYVGDRALVVRADDEDTVRRVLDSARPG